MLVSPETNCDTLMQHRDPHVSESHPAWGRPLRVVLAAFVAVLVLALFPYTPEPTTHVKILLYQCVSVLCLGLVLLGSWWRQQPLRCGGVLFWLVAAFLVVQFAAVFVAVNKGYSLFEFTKWAAMVILFFTAAHAYRTPAQVWLLFLTFCCAVAIASVYGFCQFAGWDPMPWAEQGPIVRQAPSTFGNPNLASHALVPALVFAAGLALRKGTRWTAIFLAVFLAHLAITQTRASLLALVAALLVMAMAGLAARTIRRPHWSIAAVLTGLALIAALGVLTVSGVSSFRTGSPYPFDQTLSLRYHSFHGACRMIADKPILGRGPAGYLIDNPPYWTEVEKERFSSLRKLNAHVHNEPLEIAVDAGLGAGILYLTLFVVGLCAALRMFFETREPDRRALSMTFAAFFVAYATDGLFGFNVHVPVSGVMLFLTTGAMVGIIRGSRPELPALAQTQRRVRISWRVAAFAVALVIPLLGARAFVSQWYQQRGQGATKWKAFDAAYANFAKAAKVTPHDWFPYHSLGMTCLLTQRPDEAVRHFERALKLNPNHVNSLFAVARAKFNLAVASEGDPQSILLDEAVESAERAAHLYPDFPEIHDLLGRAGILRVKLLTAERWRRAGAQDEVEALLRGARDHLVLAVEHGNENPYRLYELLAQVNTDLADIDRAGTAHIEAVQAAPEEKEGWALFARFARRYRRYDELLDMTSWHVWRLSKATPTDTQALTDAYTMKARVLLEEYDDADGAVLAYRDAVAAKPSRMDVWRAFTLAAKTPWARDRLRKALSEAREHFAAANEPTPPELRVAGMAVERDVMALHEAAMSLAEKVQTGPQARTLSLAVELDWVLQLLGDAAGDAALSDYERGRILLDSGGILGALGQFDRAEATLNQAQPLLTGQDYVRCLEQRVNVLLETRRTAEALPLLEEAAARAPDNIDVRRALANVLAQHGRVAAARFQYQLLLGLPGLTPEDRQAIEEELATLPQ